MKTFAQAFGGEPDVTADAPGRVNLLGEHTDYNEGYVLPTAIPQKTRVAMRRRRSGGVVAYSANLDERAAFACDRPPPQQFARYVFGCLREASPQQALPPLDIHIDSDVPMGVGLSSSAALEVAMLRALRSLLKLEYDDVALAQLAQRAEVNHAGVNCGILDQMASSLLDVGSMLFLDTRSFERRLLPLPAGSEILVIDSGTPRSLAASGYNRRRAECEAAAAQLCLRSLRDVDDVTKLEGLADPYARRAQHVVTENARVLQAVAGVSAAEFGALMNESHRSLSSSYEVSTADLDRLARLLQEDPAVFGAKLTGAGFGGACVALCGSGTAAQVADRVLEAFNHGGRSGRVLVPV